MMYTYSSVLAQSDQTLLVAQVIPADVDHIAFTWKARPGSSVPYKLTFIHTPGPAMEAPSVNISQTGLVPTYPDKFR